MNTLLQFPLHAKARPLINKKTKSKSKSSEDSPRGSSNPLVGEATKTQNLGIFLITLKKNLSFSLLFFATATEDAPVNDSR